MAMFEISMPLWLWSLTIVLLTLVTFVAALFGAKEYIKLLIEIAKHQRGGRNDEKN